MRTVPHGAFALNAHPFNWQQSAAALRAAAMLLASRAEADMSDRFARLKAIEEGSTEPTPPLPPPLMYQFYLLAGFALENLFKGLVIFKSPELVSDGKIKGILCSHELVNLATRADVTLTAEEDRFCQMATSAVRYWGRYPVATRAEESLARLTLRSEAVPVFDSLAERVSGLYPERLKSRTRAKPTSAT